MGDEVVFVPVALLLDQSLTASTKIVWIAMRLAHAAETRAIEACTGLSRPTVLMAAARVKTGIRVSGGQRVRVPSALLAEPTIGAQAKVLYGLLQATPDFRGRSGQFTYASMASRMNLGRSTVKAAVAQLVGGGWVQVSQKNQRRPIRFTLTTLAQSLGQAEVDAARQRLTLAKFGGEALMQEWLTLLIDSTNFTDNARPGFLVNPLTNQRLELDRFYPPNLAFEFNGAQHRHSTEQFSQEQVDSQRLRDLIKAGLCVYAGIRLVIIEGRDLSLEGMLHKIGPHVPLRDRSQHELLIDYLEDACMAYRASEPATR